MDYAEKIQRCHEYVEALEEERRKIQVFRRELPLCLELVIQAIEACKRELSGTTTTEFTHGQSECSEQTTSSDGTGTTRPMVLEQFIPIKRTNSSSHNENEHEDDEEEEDEDEHHSHEGNKSIDDNDEKKKSDWLRSVQLWNPSSPDPPVKEDLPRKAAVTEVKRNGGAFQPFHKEKCEKSNTAGKSNQSGSSIAKTQSSSVPASDTSSSDETKTREASKNNNNDDGGCGGGGGGDNSKKEEKDGQSQRKQRRCWSPELHRRFLHSLQQLGGSHATPKQIRELMKVDGLTNDEVKSHLQKYRLHTRRPSPTMHNNNAQAPQFVVVGGIWVPPPDYAAAAATTTSCETTTISGTNGIYAPVATLPVTTHLQKHTQFENVQSEGRSGNHSTEGGRRRGCGARSNSPATSSSTHTTTNSPVF
ncbi:transcription factor HHO2-like isoform X2 [Mercurialis annua]|uniref:transcription factor HHO2-like isoform X2 n=1 Tax=Mercurialis annua TaxID=3986 RepID=UPI002160E858|nr:transcription factor HHO2-like isoform X2 [Mercurialis annua]